MRLSGKFVLVCIILIIIVLVVLYYSSESFRILLTEGFESLKEWFDTFAGGLGNFLDEYFW